MFYILFKGIFMKNFILLIAVMLNSFFIGSSFGVKVGNDGADIYEANFLDWNAEGTRAAGIISAVQIKSERYPEKYAGSNSIKLIAAGNKLKGCIEAIKDEFVQEARRNNVRFSLGMCLARPLFPDEIIPLVNFYKEYRDLALQNPIIQQNSVLLNYFKD